MKKVMDIGLCSQKDFQFQAARPNAILVRRQLRGTSVTRLFRTRKGIAHDR
jgi:hypothetical protein